MIVKAPAFCVPAPDDEERLIHFHDVHVSEDLMDAWIRWYDRNKDAIPMPSVYESPPVLIGKFIGEKNAEGGWDGTFIAGCREYAVRDSVVCFYPR